MHFSNQSSLKPAPPEFFSKQKCDPPAVSFATCSKNFPPISIYRPPSPFFCQNELAGIPADTPLVAINRQCSSGLQAIATIAGAIQQGTIDAGIGAGVESMSMWGFDAGVNLKNMSESIVDCAEARDCMIPMGITSENVSAKFGISREKQDALAAASHEKAAKAQKAGLFKSEIVPVKTAAGKVIDQDEGIRAGTKAEGLAKLKPAFQVGGSTTAGNSSQTTDGAAATFLARRSFAKKHGLKIEGRLVSVAVKG